ncbi:MAG: hypothetical protein HYS81_00395 [Candidatus Aenigmatarchaeota archaeon]|nr:MAG: hypothetical protein HYS81_00395 [Candidatus Aenigmarchaeota archaeon]
MGVQVEFNTALGLRNISEFKISRRVLEECIPERLGAGETYAFLKKGQRNYAIGDEIPLVETEGDNKISRPLASVVIEEAAHFLIDGSVHTKGTYRVVSVFDPKDPAVHFEGVKRVR